MDQYVIGVIVSNVSGVLSRVSGMFTRRGFNIDCLTVGETESSGFSRITVAFHGDDDIKERIVQQLQKLHDVREVEVLSRTETVVRELLLIKIRNKADSRQASSRERHQRSTHLSSSLSHTASWRCAAQVLLLSKEETTALRQ